jgi:hypothetical protein
MKKLFLISSLTIWMIAATRVNAQITVLGNNGGPTDYVGWNNAQAFPLQIRHNANQPISFFTNNTEYMRLMSTGWLGLNTNAPDMRFHVNDGGILSTGTTGTNPDLGAGTRLMWIPDRAAFRAGRVGVAGASATFWNAANVGISSVAMGTDNLASGTHSFALGESNESTGLRSFAFGTVNINSGELAISLGHSNTVSGTNSTAIGFRNVITSNNSYVLGRALLSSANENIVIGRGIDDVNQLENNQPLSLMIGFDSDVSTFFVGPGDFRFFPNPASSHLQIQSNQNGNLIIRDV